MNRVRVELVDERKQYVNPYSVRYPSTEKMGQQVRLIGAMCSDQLNTCGDVSRRLEKAQGLLPGGQPQQVNVSFCHC
jgi:hypothetical protein